MVIHTENKLEERIEKYWDTRSHDFSRVRRRELSGPNAKLWRQLLSRHLPPQSGLKVLDVGMGAGFLTIILSHMGHEVTGIDMSAGMVREAESNLRDFACHATLLKMDAQALTFPACIT